ncbi:hypothetical protein [Azonexus hydrophilus]|uniref:Uncharacterized protein n=1 Tax=Azonexus hydrophilus TaxID=418702 RepID=A0ABZ2XLH0_9RHOO
MGKHQEIMQAESICGDMSLLGLAKEYHSWATEEAVRRLSVLESFSQGEQLLTTEGMRQCLDAYLGLAHLAVLVGDAAERHEVAVPALRDKTKQEVCCYLGTAKSYYDDLKTVFQVVEQPEKN